MSPELLVPGGEATAHLNLELPVSWDTPWKISRRGVYLKA